MMPKQRIALFIDAENAAPSYLSAYLKHTMSLGKLTIARCYGNAAALKSWDAAIVKHHIVPVQTPPSAAKANASDFTLIIDAVSLLHRNLFDHAVIVSSDADFTLLAIHIREQGKGVDGIGESKAVMSLKSAFDQFITVGATAAAKPPPVKVPAKPAPAKAPTNRVQLNAAPVSNSDSTAELMNVAKKLLVPGSKTTLSNLGKQLLAQMGNAYPSGRLSRHLAKHSDVFKIEGISIERLR